MAKKKTDPEVDYKEIQTTPLDEIIGAPAVDETPAEVETSPSDAPKTPETPEKAPETTETVEEEVDFDPIAFQTSIEEKIGKVSEETAKRVLEEVMKKQTPAKVDGAPDTELLSPWQKENRTPKDYDEIAEWAIEKNRILTERAAEAKKSEEESKEKAQKEYDKSQIDNFNKYTDDQLEDLYAAGKLPRIGNKNNPDDPGVVARRNLFQKMLDVNIERQKEGKLPVYSIKEIYYEHYQAAEDIKPKQPAGADAPVSAGKMSSGVEEKEINYAEIHKKPLTQILMEAVRGK